MLEHSGQGERAFGWTFEVSHQSVSGDRISESPYHVGIADQGEAKAVLENSIWCGNDQVTEAGSNLGYRNSLRSFAYAPLNLALDPNIPM